jgi:hypothetical protein
MIAQDEVAPPRTLGAPGLAFETWETWETNISTATILTVRGVQHLPGQRAQSLAE